MSALEILKQEIEQVNGWHTELLQVSKNTTVRLIASRMEPKLLALLNVIIEQDERIRRLESTILSNNQCNNGQ
jgi:hypothetical protein